MTAISLAGVGMTREDAMRMKDLVASPGKSLHGRRFVAAAGESERSQEQGSTSYVHGLGCPVQTFTKSVEANTESAKQCLMN
eukprot:3155026-Rhodomonas_salina.1